MRSTRASILERFLLLLSLCCASTIWSTAVAKAADVIRIEVEFFDGDHEAPTNRATVWTSERRVRIEQHAPGESAPPPVFLYRGDQDLLLSVSESARSYVKIERRMLSLLGSGRRTARREVEGQLDPLPPDQQRLFAHLLGGAPIDSKRPDEPLVVTRSDESDSVAGFPCKRVSLSRSRRLLAQGCIAEWETVGLTPADVEVFRSLAELTHDAMGSRMPIPIELVPGQPLDLVVQFGGFPLSFERAGNVPGKNAIRVASVERIPAADSLFEVPSGFSERAGLAGLAGLSSLLARPGSAAPMAPVPAAVDFAAEDADVPEPPPHGTNAIREPAASVPVRALRAPKPYRSIGLFEDPE